MSASFEDQFKALFDELVDMWISGLDQDLFQDIHIAALTRMGEDAVPRLLTYLAAQAELERELVSDLEKYFEDKRELEMEYRKIVTSQTTPQWTGSNENVDALSSCASKMVANELVFVKRWGGSPDVVTGFSSPKGCPSRAGVEGTLWVLESIGGPTVIPLLQELVEHADKIERMGLLNGYGSVFTLVKKSFRRIKERI